MFRKEGESKNWNEMVSNLMKKKGINQKQLSKLSDITESSISRYLNSDKTPRMDVVVNVAKALQVETDYFLKEVGILKIIKQITGLLAAAMVLFTISFTMEVYASDFPIQSTDYSDISEAISQEVGSLDISSRDIIGGSYKSASTNANILPNRLVVDYSASATKIFITYTNIGLDAIDTVYSTVAIGGAIRSVHPFVAKVGVTSKTVSFDMRKCHEDISVKTVAMDGGDTIGTTTTPGKRDLPSSLVNLWHKGSFGSAEASINYHFKIHGSELGISNIRSYVESAQNFRGNLKGATESNVNGSTSGVKRYKKNGKYIDICGAKNTGKIISYGKQ